MMSTKQTVKDSITEKLQVLTPLFLQVDNESHMHNVPPGSETHFKITLVCQQFEEKMLVARHRQVNGLLAEHLQQQIHALSLHTFTPEEWRNNQEKTTASPQCMGGSKR